MVLWVRSVGSMAGAGSMGTGQKRLALHMPPGLLVRSSRLAGVRG